MTTLALSAPTTSIASNNAIGTVLPTSETALSSNAGFSFPNNGAVLLRVCIGSSGAGNLSLVVQRLVEQEQPAAIVIALSNSTNYIFGPFSPGDFNDVNGLFQGLLSVQTGNSVGVYKLNAPITV